MPTSYVCPTHPSHPSRPPTNPPTGNAESLAVPKGLRVVPVPIDADGIIPEGLAAVLAELQARSAAPGGPRFPKLLYTVPNGQNPVSDRPAVCGCMGVRVCATCSRLHLGAAYGLPGTRSAMCRPP